MGVPRDQRRGAGGGAGAEERGRQHQECTRPAQIDDLLNPPDWFPDEHPPAPSIVQKGHGGALACGACHLMSGEGHPESAGLTGFTAAYLIQQMADFKSGVRKDSARMNAIAKDVSDEEIRAGRRMVCQAQAGGVDKVTEAETVPKTFVGQGRMRFVAARRRDGADRQPHHHRAAGSDASAESAIPKSGFIAYVPSGSIAKGKALVETGGSGKTIACSICHGDDAEGTGGRAHGWRAFIRSTSRASSISSRTARETASTRS